MGSELTPEPADRILQWNAGMKIRIKATPTEREVDGVHLDGLLPGMVVEVSSSIGSWLIAAGYGEPEMRSDDRRTFSSSEPTALAADRRRKRR